MYLLLKKKKEAEKEKKPASEQSRSPTDLVHSHCHVTPPNNCLKPIKVSYRLCAHHTFSLEMDIIP